MTDNDPLRTTSRSSRWGAAGLLASGLLLVAGPGLAQETTVRGRVLYNPTLSECWQEAPCLRELALTPPEGWVPTPAAVNVVVQGTNRVTKTDREGFYEIGLPSADASLMFLYIGHNRIEVPVDGRSVVDVRLTPTPIPVLERLLGLIMPRVHEGELPDIDRLAADADVNRETARDILWLVLGDRPMARHYPGEYIPDYRFDDGADRTGPGGGRP